MAEGEESQQDVEYYTEYQEVYRILGRALRDRNFGHSKLMRYVRSGEIQQIPAPGQKRGSWYLKEEVDGLAKKIDEMFRRPPVSRKKQQKEVDTAA